MTTLFSKLALAAALTATIPAAALASDCQHDHGRPVAAYPVPAPAPAVYGSVVFGVDHEYGRAVERRRQASWREQERARLRLEYARLDEARADFYARPGVRRGQVRKFERWYAAERAELDREWSALSWYAAR